jgi:hypothetical protein
MGRLTRGPIYAAVAVLPVVGPLLLLFILAPSLSLSPILSLPGPLSLFWLISRLSDRAREGGSRGSTHVPEKTRRGAHGGMFVKRDAVGVDCMAVVVSTGPEVGGAPISRGISDADTVGGVVGASCMACRADGGSSCRLE